jgi:hypothetical protein
MQSREDLLAAQELLPKRTLIIHVPISVRRADERLLSARKIALFGAERDASPVQLEIDLLCTTCLRKHPFSDVWQRLMTKVLL